MFAILCQFCNNVLSGGITEKGFMLSLAKHPYAISQILHFEQDDFFGDIKEDVW
jgi:hypothetical protein